MKKTVFKIFAVLLVVFLMAFMFVACLKDEQEKYEESVVQGEENQEDNTQGSGEDQEDNVQDGEEDQEDNVQGDEEDQEDNTQGDEEDQEGNNFQDNQGNQGESSEQENTPVMYFVEFNSEGGNTVEKQNVVYGDYANKPTDPVKIGYIFDGWYLDGQEFSFEDTPVYFNIVLVAQWKEINCRITVSSNIEGAVEFVGSTEQILTSEDPLFDPVEVVANLGYKFCYYEVNGTQYHSSEIMVENITEDTVVTVVADYATSELPIVNIYADGEITSKEDYVDMTFSISNCDGELEDIEGGIRLRGNSTRRYDKKPYRIKFEKKQGLFGLEKAKSWVLLAEYIDPSALHNYTAFSLAGEMDGLAFTPTPHKVNVYLNGEFMGLYTLCEQVQENEGRMNIEEEITAEMTELKDFNFFICMDKSVIEDEGVVEGENYFYLEEYDKYIELKYPEKSQFVSEEQFEKFFADLKEYVKYLFDIFAQKDAEAIAKEVNLNSLADYLIIDQIMGEQDHAHKSFNMYFTHTSNNENENNKLNFGPIWDYDWSLYTEWTSLPNVDYEVSTGNSYSNVFFKAMAQIPEFYEIVKERYSTGVSDMLGEFIEEIIAVEDGMKESVALNHERWYGEYDENMSVDNIDFLNRWLVTRKELLDGLWVK